MCSAASFGESRKMILPTGESFSKLPGSEGQARSEFLELRASCHHYCCAASSCAEPIANVSVGGRRQSSHAGVFARLVSLANAAPSETT